MEEWNNVNISLDLGYELLAVVSCGEGLSS